MRLLAFVLSCLAAPVFAQWKPDAAAIDEFVEAQFLPWPDCTVAARDPMLRPLVLSDPFRALYRLWYTDVDVDALMIASLDRLEGAGRLVSRGEALSLAVCPETIFSSSAPSAAVIDAYLLPYVSAEWPDCRLPAQERHRLIRRLALHLSLYGSAFENLPDAEKEAIAAASLERLIASGALIEEPGGDLRDAACAPNPLRFQAEIDRARKLLDSQDRAADAALLEGAMAAAGCVVHLSREAEFIAFTLRWSAPDFGFALPDDPDLEAWPPLDGFIRNLAGALDRGGGVLAREGRLVVAGDVARLNGCTPGGEVLFSRPSANAPNSRLAAAYGAVGCAYRLDEEVAFFALLIRSAAASLGVELTEDETHQAQTAPWPELLPERLQTEAFDAALKELLSAEGQMRAAGQIVEQGGVRRLLDCQPTGDGTALDPWRDPW